MSSEWSDGSPWPGAWTVRRALAAYLAENGFTEAGYTEKWTHVSAFGLSFVIPNTKSHQRALRFHDLHHVATGYGTDLVGEGEISIVEARRGLSKVGLYVAFIVVGVALMGVCISPRRMLEAFRATSGVVSLWTLDVPYEELLDMTVADLRRLVGVPADGLARHPRGLHGGAPRPDALSVS